jgi:predicted GIY-YIG superfamily endonuclease
MSAEFEYEIDEVRMPRMFANMRKAGMYRRCACAGCGPCRSQAQSLLRRVSRYGRSRGSFNPQRWGDRFQISSARVGNRLMNVLTDFGGGVPRVVDTSFRAWKPQLNPFPSSRPPLHGFPRPPVKWIPPVVIGRPPVVGSSPPPAQPLPAPSPNTPGNSGAAPSGMGNATLGDDSNTYDSPALDDAPPESIDDGTTSSTADDSSIESEMKLGVILPTIAMSLGGAGQNLSFKRRFTSRLGDIPKSPGVYILKFGSGSGDARNFSYIGSTNNLQARIQSHLSLVSRYYRAEPSQVIPFVYVATVGAGSAAAMGEEQVVLAAIKQQRKPGEPMRAFYRRVGLLNQQELMFEYV